MKLLTALKQIEKLNLQKSSQGASPHVYEVNGKKLKLSCNPGNDDIHTIFVIKEYPDQENMIWTFPSLKKALNFCGLNQGG